MNHTAALHLPLHAGLAPLLSSLYSAPVSASPCPPQARDLPAVSELNALLRAGHCNGAGLPIRFAAPSALTDADEGYEARIWRSGEIITRPDNWHDALNALAWIAFPQTKRELNRLHCRHQPAAAPPGGKPMHGTARGTARDALTLFDEDGLLVACADPALAALLAGFHWKELFWQQREAVVRCMRFHVFGHGLADKLRAPFRGLTAKARVFAVDATELQQPPAQQLAAIDARAAAWLREPAALASTRVYSPLPVLGIPGWHADNAGAGYYDDTWQFRPGRRV